VDVTQFVEGDAIYPLLEYNEGFIFGEDNIFYANLRTKTIELIHDMDVNSLIKLEVSVDEHEAFDNLIASSIVMEDG
jgi:hypothetical protein